MIYLDYAASTPLDKRISALPIIGNASSVHGFGRAAATIIDTTRDELADFLQADALDIIFTGGATESNNLICKGAVWAALTADGSIPHVLTTTIEHPSILEPLRWLERKKLCAVTYLAPDHTGRITVGQVREAITPHTHLVTVQYVNSEIGTIQPISEIGHFLKQYHPNIIFHTDATQASQYLDCTIPYLQVDALSMSAHKMYGPSGVGALYFRRGAKIEALLHGGEQEFGKRSGTLNVTGIAMFGQAVALLRQSQAVYRTQAEKLYQHCVTSITTALPAARYNGSVEYHVPHIMNYSFSNTTSERLLQQLDLSGIAVSAGSACQAGAISGSTVLRALGHAEERARCALRVSWGKDSSTTDIDKTVASIRSFVV